MSTYRYTYNRIGIKNFSLTQELERFLYNNVNSNTIIELYSLKNITSDALNLLKKYKNVKEIQLHLNNCQFVIDQLTTLPENTKIWFEIDIDNLETIPKININAIFNIKVNNINVENTKKILDYFSTFKTDDIYIVDESLYVESNKPSTTYRIRNKLIKQSLGGYQPAKIIRYCKDENYIVFDCSLNKLEPCIDINKQFNTKEEIDTFQNSNYNECSYYCNKIIYDFEDKLKKLIRKNML